MISIKSYWKTLLMFLAIISFQYANAQQQNKTYTDCNSVSESIYGIIGQGTPLIIASKGFDCSICMSQAPAIQTFAAQHPEVRIWGAMNYKYSSATPTCTGVNSWKTAYSWNNIFMFPDVNDEWQADGYPTYYVISPVDSSIVYEGPIFSTASSTALSLAPTGISNSKEDSDCFVNYYNQAVEISCTNFINAENLNATIFDISGKEIHKAKILEDFISLNISLSKGIYLVAIFNKTSMLHCSKFLVN